MHTSGIQKGFSLVELMVSLTIFSIVMTVSIGTLLVMIDANAKAQALYSVMTNLSFAVDSITRNVRTGYEHYCATSESQLYTAFSRIGNDGMGYPRQDCDNGAGALAFTREVDGVRVGYRLFEGAIQQREGNGNWLDITANDVVIDNLEFVAVGTSNTGTDGEQPQIAIRIEGHVVNGLDTDTDFRLQTRVSQRILDY